MFTYFLKDIKVSIFLGAEDLERENLQEILVSLEFGFEGEKAAVSDDLADTMDYSAIEAYIKNFPENRPYRLLEKLHQDLREGLEKKFPEIEIKTLSIEKFPFETGSVIIKK